MRLYLASWPTSIKEGEGSLFVGGHSQWEGINKASLLWPSLNIRILISFYYFHETDLGADLERYFPSKKVDLFADSGAFSAWTKNEKVEVEAYGDWLLENREYLSIYASLDVRNDLDATLRNQEYLEGLGLRPVPVFHAGSPWDIFEEYCKRYNYIALGGVAGARFETEKTSRWYAHCWRRAEGRAQFHGFGATGWGILRSFPFYSVDSTSWASGFRFGYVPLFHPRRHKFYRIKLGDARSAYRWRELLSIYGIHPDDFADRERNKRLDLATLGAISWMHAEKFIENYHGKVELSQRECFGPEVKE